jgi:hypothetical protein
MSTQQLTAASDRYAELRDRRLALVLTEEDAAEESRLDPLERTTCRLHKRWLYQCVHSSAHVIVVTGHRWCRECECSASIGVDELTGDVVVRCTRCHRSPSGPPPASSSAPAARAWPPRRTAGPDHTGPPPLNPTHGRCDRRRTTRTRY